MKRQLFLMIALLWCSRALADAPIIVKGTILEAACSVAGENGSSAVDVKFGEVSLEDVGTAQSDRDFNLQVNCDGPAPTGKILKMFLKSTSGSLPAIGSNVLATSVTGLGIALTTGSDGSVPVDLEKWLPITGIDTSVEAPIGKVPMKARLVKVSGSTLQAGAFTAAANLVVNYQ